MVRIIIKTPQDITRIQSKFRVLKGMLPRLQDMATKDAADDILDEIHIKMRQNDFSEKIIDATFVGKTDRIGSFLRQHFISNFVSDTGFDVSNAREEGTANGVLRRPKRPDGSLRWVAKSGEPIFRKFSRPKGIERLLIIEKTLFTNKEEFKNRIAENLAISVQKVLGV